MNHTLFRSRADKIIGGVCGGLGHYFNIDPILIRVLFVVLAFGKGLGLFLYLLLWIVLPSASEGETSARDTIRSNAEEIAQRARSLGESLHSAMARSNRQPGFVGGAILIALGFLFLMDNLHILWLRWLNFDALWPLLLVVAGATLILRKANEEHLNTSPTSPISAEDTAVEMGDRPAEGAQ